jgi:transcriptional regulator with PAS, ATPase and Fis domain
MVTINCAAIPKDLEESEFFGHIKGAFTGAIRDKNGIIFAADKSTLFLDEVAELSAGVQAKLLRVLENGEFLRIGETTPRTVDIRIIAATNRSLTQMVDAGAFRQDLYFRLGMTIRTVPLAEHPEDIPEIIRDLVTEIHARDARYPDRLTSEAMACLVKREWQGNVRELKQAIQVLCQTAVGKHRVNATDIEAVLDGTCASSDGEAWYSDEKSKVLQEFELDYFSRLLKKYSGNLSQAAKASGMHRPNLIKKLKCLGIEPDSYRE